MKKKLCLLIAMLVSVTLEANAALDLVSGGAFNPATGQLAGIPPAGDSSQVRVSMAHGFPVWYRDGSGTTLAVCVEQSTFCLELPQFAGNPTTFPFNFPGEFFWWAVSNAAIFTSTQNGTPIINNKFLFVAALEGSFFPPGSSLEGHQSVFGRIRIRGILPVAGTYRVTHPYGTADYVVTDAAVNRDINETQDIMGDFLAAMKDGVNPPVEPARVNLDGISIGPFLLPAPGSVTESVTDAQGNTYIANPLISHPLPLTGEASITLLNPPAGFILNAADGAQVVKITQFFFLGKKFNTGPNIPPIAMDDFATTRMGDPIEIDVLANDSDPVAPATNVHKIDPGAIALLGTPGGSNPRGTTAFGNLFTTIVTAHNGIVERKTNVATGKASLVYTPGKNPDGTPFTGVDTFQYVVQDTGGILNTDAVGAVPVMVTVSVEKMAPVMAVMRPKFMRLHVRGTSSFTHLRRTDDVGRDRYWTAIEASQQGSSVGSRAQGTLNLIVTSDQTACDAILNFATIPASAIQSVTINLGGKGATGATLFTLFDAATDGAFALPFKKTITTIDAAALAAIQRGDAYVMVSTADVPAGELRGQIGRNIISIFAGPDAQRPAIATVSVDDNGMWEYNERLPVSPSVTGGTLFIKSSNGIGVSGVAVQVR